MSYVIDNIIGYNGISCLGMEAFVKYDVSLLQEVLLTIACIRVDGNNIGSLGIKILFKSNMPALHCIPKYWYKIMQIVAQ